MKKIFYCNIMKNFCFVFQRLVIWKGVKIIYIFKRKINAVTDIFVISGKGSKAFGVANIFKLCV